MVVRDAYVPPGFLTPELTQLFFPKPPTTFLTQTTVTQSAPDLLIRGHKKKKMLDPTISLNLGL